MKTMMEYANEYAKQHRGKCHVTDVTEYSCKVTPIEDKKSKKPAESTILMLSYFL